jgi:hypothetical protein
MIQTLYKEKITQDAIAGDKRAKEYKLAVCIWKVVGLWLT